MQRSCIGLLVPSQRTRCCQHVYICEHVTTGILLIIMHIKRFVTHHERHMKDEAGRGEDEGRGGAGHA